jgi:hypothetical protein
MVLDLTAPLVRAIELVGGPSAVAAGLRLRGFPKMSPSHVRNWVKRDKKTPSEVCRHLEALVAETGRGVVTRYELRPDVFGDFDDASGALLNEMAVGGLTNDERITLLAALQRGHEAAAEVIESFDVNLATRRALLDAAKRAADANRDGSGHV